MAFADLHMHSNASDGICSPELIAQEASVCDELEAIALTDHDTVSGLDAAARGCESCGLTFVPGVEITTKHKGRAVHMLGYFIDPSNPSLTTFLDTNKMRRAERTYEMADRLAEDGYPLSSNDLKSTTAVPNRPMLARLLVRRGVVADVDEAFKTLLNTRSKYYIDAVYPETIDAIARIRDAGGYAFVAHPARYGILDLIEGFANEGITGLEAYHSLQTPEQSHELIALAKQLGLAISGGSDWHGDTMHHATPGCCGLSENEYTAFLQACGRA